VIPYQLHKLDKGSFPLVLMVYVIVIIFQAFNGVSIPGGSISVVSEMSRYLFPGPLTKLDGSGTSGRPKACMCRLRGSKNRYTGYTSVAASATSCFAFIRNTT